MKTILIPILLLAQIPAYSSQTKFNKSNLIGAKESGGSVDLIDLEDVSFLIRCSNHFPPKKLQSISC